jgi:glutathione S-transferase
VIVESTVIIAYLDEAFPQPALMPVDPYRRALARLWMKKIDDYLHAACGVVTFATANRRVLLKLTPEELAARFDAIPDPVYRERQRLAVTEGVAAPHVPPAVRAFDTYIGEMEDALARTPWLAGDVYSLADVAATPYLNRAQLVGLDRLWAERRHVSDWLVRVRGRANYQPGMDGHLSAADRARFDLPREQIWREIETAMSGPRGAA